MYINDLHLSGCPGCQSRLGEPPMAPRKQPEPDSINRIMLRGLELLKQPERLGVHLSHIQRHRINCWLMTILQSGSDDRFITAQSVLDFRNFTYKAQPDFSSAKQWLLPAYTQRIGKILSDNAILRELVRIDEAIIDGRQKINQEFAQQMGVVHVRVRMLRNWVAARQQDRLSIYHCFRG